MNLTQTQLNSAKNLKCEKCESLIFKNVFVIKTISALLMPDGKETLIPVPVFACNDCGHVNQNFAEDLKIDKNE